MLCFIYLFIAEFLNSVFMYLFIIYLYSLNCVVGIKSSVHYFNYG